MKKSLSRILALAFAALFAVSCTVEIIDASKHNPDNPDNPDNPNPPVQEDTTHYEPGEIVDLGLSVKWASCNLGATKPEEFGNCYQWGDAMPATQRGAGVAGYKWYSGTYVDNFEILKYNTSDYMGLVDGRTELVPEDDAATVALGDKWRMPTGEELRELKQNTEREYIEVNGVRCIKLTARNGHYIILPAAGHDMNLEEGWFYWTSTLGANDYAYCYYPSYSTPMSENIGEIISTQVQRYLQLSIRPVYGDRAPRTLVPYANTWDITEVFYDGATVRGNVTCLTGLNQITEYGLCLSKTVTQPTVNDIKVECPKSDGRMNGEDFEFTHRLTGLESESVYYVRTYAIVNGQTLYGRALTFETYSDPGTLDYVSKTVDLGLSVPWAGWNIGAAKPQETGGYFTWADPEDKTGSTHLYKDNYKWSDGSYFTKYVPYNERWAGRDNYDNLLVVRPGDDAAFMNWGENWRMPTNDEWQELKDNCQWKYMVVDGMYGYRVTGPNGNTIFLPLAGTIGYSGLVNFGESGSYWSSNLKTDGYLSRPEIRNTSKAYIAYLNGDSAKVDKETDFRYYALSVRAVWGNEPLSAPVEGVYLDKSMVELYGGDTFQLTATLTPVDPLDTEVTWSTSDASVASVENGLVTALSAGTADITVTTHDGGFTATCTFIVHEAVPAIETDAFVDLGLSVKWASHNLGTDDLDGLGSFYAWGMTAPSSSYFMSEYGFAEYQSYYGYKYNKYSFYGYNTVGIPDSLSTLLPEDDAAIQNNYGRMPTKAEVQELIDNCTFRLDYYMGDTRQSQGYYVTGPNGKTIFIAYRGYRQGDYYYYDSTKAYIWTSDLNTASDAESRDAFALIIGETLQEIKSVRREYGLTVRPVQDY